MPSKDKQIDAYIARSADFAKPVLKHFRELVHKACPSVEETIKWSFPHFVYKGTVCAIASFKNHCAVVFPKAAIMADRHKILRQMEKNAMGNLGSIKTISDLPPDKLLIEYIKEAVKLNEADVKVPRKSDKEKKELAMPAYFIKALSKNKKALTTFEVFSYTNKKDYVEWITEAKTEETRNNRLTAAMEWIAEGKIRNWKYLKK